MQPTPPDVRRRRRRLCAAAGLTAAGAPGNVEPRPGSGRCCAAITAVCAPLAMPRASAGIPLGRDGCFQSAAFYPEKPRRARPSPMRAGTLCRRPAPDTRGRLHHFAKGVAMQLTGAEIVIRCLQEEGVEYVFGYPGGAVLNIYDELFKQEKVKHVLVRHEQGAVHAADGYSRSSTKVGVCLVTSGPGRHECGHGNRDRLHGLDPDGRADRPGADARHRPGRVPGVRHGRHHAALRQAQLPRQGRQGHRDHHQEGVLSRRHRPAGPGAGRHPEGRDPGHDRVELPEDGLAALVQPGHQRPLRTDQEGGAASARREEADGLRRRRRGPERRRAAADAPRAAAGLSLHEHADGAGRIPRHRPAVHRHARHARHLRIEHGDAALRRADRDRRALRRPRHRQPAALLPQRPQDHPHRHRSVVDLQARQGRRADRRLRRARCSTKC